MTTPMQDRLRHCARHTGLDAVAEMLNEAADAFEREVEARKQAQAQSEDYKAALTKAEHQIERLQADAERYRWLRERMAGADFDWNESGMCGLFFEMPPGTQLGASCDDNIDAARKDTK